MIDAFLDHHFAINGTSERRRVQQRKALLEFEDHCAPLSIEQAGPQQVEGWMAHLLRDGKLHPNTVRWKVNMVRPLYVYLYKQDVVTHKQLLLIQDVKHPKGSRNQNEPQPYDPKKVLTFWRELAEHRPYGYVYLRRWRRGTSRWPRVWKHAERIQIEAIATLALYCGLRQQEIATVSIDDIDPLNEYIPVLNAKKHGADRSIRRVPFPEGARRRVEAWLDFRQEIDPPHEYPWCSLGMYEVHHRNSLPRSTLAEMFGKIGGGWRLHRFRHTCATEWLRAGMPLEQVSKVMGHANITQTLAYTRILPEDARASMERFERAFERRIERRLEPEETDDNSQEVV